VPARVLVVERSPLVAELTLRALREAGHAATLAHDGPSLERALQGPLDVVVVDPSQAFGFADGLAERLRTLPSPPHLIFSASRPVQELERLAAETGPQGLAAASPGAEALLAEIKRVVPSASRMKRVLLVDDSDTTAWILAQALEAKGFEVHTASSAEVATPLLLKRETRPELVLLDVKMPNIDGEHFCRFIKGSSLFAGIRVLLCSAADEPELQRICREAGADGYVTKEAVLTGLQLDPA